MKYSDLISFNPIEDVIQLTTADDANRAKEYVKSYVMSDTMAANLKSPVLDQLQMDEVVDNKGVLVVGNYGTGKSHLMSVISSIAKDADNLQYLQNKNFAKEMECIAGKFEVLRIEIGGVTMSLREILFGFIEDDFAARGIDFEVPDFDTVRDNKKLIRDMMMAFSAKYPDKGYLIVVDEFLSYLTSYLSNIEFIDLGANFKQKLEAAKDEFRSARDSILTGTSGDAAAQKVNAALEKVKEEYIGIYFEEHKKKRLDIDDAKRRGKLQESSALANLRKLRCVEILSAAKLTKIEQDMANLKVCYELTPTELKTTHICPHCHYNLGDQVPNVAGQLDNLDIRIDDLVTEWTQTLLNTISDPIVASQKEYLSAEQQKAIDDFIASGTLPKRVDDFFIKAIQALLKGFEPVVVDAKDLMDKLTKLPPMDEVSFKQKLNELIAGYTKGKDEGKLRIIVK